MNIVLFEPEIAPNTGNIIRLCANTKSNLHLIKPLGFDLDNKQLKRAGLDYHEYCDIKIYDNFTDFITTHNPVNIFACSTKANLVYSKIQYTRDCYLLFGPETRGLPNNILQQFAPKHKIYIPMAPQSRSLNLSNAVAIILYRAWSQHDYTYT